jgi:hypothetical protein
MLDVTIVLRQARLDATCRLNGIASQYHAVNFTDFICNIIFQSVNCACFLRNTISLR